MCEEDTGTAGILMVSSDIPRDYFPPCTHIGFLSNFSQGFSVKFFIISPLIIFSPLFKYFYNFSGLFPHLARTLDLFQSQDLPKSTLLIFKGYSTKNQLCFKAHNTLKTDHSGPICFINGQYGGFLKDGFPHGVLYLRIRT